MEGCGEAINLHEPQLSGTSSKYPESSRAGHPSCPPSLSPNAMGPAWVQLSPLRREEVSLVGFKEGFVAGPGVGGWWSLQAKAWGAWREVLVAAGAPLVAAPSGCWLRWSCAGLLGCESSTVFKSAIWDRSSPASGKCRQILPMPQG